VTRPVRFAALILLATVGLAACQTAVVPPPPPPPMPEAAPPPPPSCPRYTFHQEGRASWYGRTHHGRQTASGAIFDMNALTAAHRALPLGTRVRVTHIANGRSVELPINDRGPYIRGRIIDLSYAAAQRLGFAESGVAEVRIEIVERC
jgi:rare lipoprotein A